MTQAQDKLSFNGLNSHLGNIYKFSNSKTRPISPENFTGEPEKAAMAEIGNGTGSNAARELGQGWKVSPSIIVEPGEVFTLAEIDGPGGIQRIWMTPTKDWCFRFYSFTGMGSTIPL